MPNEAKLGLVLGIGITIALAVCYRPKDTAKVQPPPINNVQVNEVQGQTTSLRK